MRSQAVPEDEGSPVSPHASQSRPWRFSAVDRVLYVRPWITGTFERTPCVRTQAFFQLPINRPLVILFSVLVFFGGDFFREHFASVSLALPLLFVSFYFKVIFNALF
jgi:ATP/ADP translocase